MNHDKQHFEKIIEKVQSSLTPAGDRITEIKVAPDDLPLLWAFGFPVDDKKVEGPHNLFDGIVPITYDEEARESTYRTENGKYLPLPCPFNVVES